MYYLVYKIENKINGKIYIGCHITNNIDDKYMGSGTYLKRAIKKYGLENFTKCILYNFDNKLDMLKKEAELVNKEFIKRKDTYNIIEGGTFNTSGFITVKDAAGNTSLVSVTDIKYLSGELVSVSTGKMTAKDKNGNYFYVDTTDPRIKTGELTSIETGFATVKDINGINRKILNTSSEYLSGKYVGINKYMKTVRDKDGNCFNISINDPRIKTGELVSIWINKKHSEKTKEKMRMHKGKQKGEKNSQFGTCWIYNAELKENKKIKKEDLNTYLKSGWIKGRKIK